MSVRVQESPYIILYLGVSKQVYHVFYHNRSKQMTKLDKTRLKVVGLVPASAAIGFRVLREL